MGNRDVVEAPSRLQKPSLDNQEGVPIRRGDVLIAAIERGHAAQDAPAAASSEPAKEPVPGNGRKDKVDLGNEPPRSDNSGRGSGTHWIGDENPPMIRIAPDLPGGRETWVVQPLEQLSPKTREMLWGHPAYSGGGGAWRCGGEGWEKGWRRR